jgi:hypothetical protein
MINFNKDIAPSGKACVFFEITNLCSRGVSGAYNASLRERYRGLFIQPWSIGNDHPFEILKGLLFEARFEAREVGKSMGGSEDGKFHNVHSRWLNSLRLFFR